MEQSVLHHMFSILLVRLKYYVKLERAKWIQKNGLQITALRMQTIWTDAINLFFFISSVMNKMFALAHTSKASIKSTSRNECVCSCSCPCKSVYSSICMIYSISTASTANTRAKTRIRLIHVGIRCAGHIDGPRRQWPLCLLYSIKNVLLIINKVDKMWSFCVIVRCLAFSQCSIGSHVWGSRGHASQRIMHVL